jgi:GNAT superfamily N-acetyltransferase
MDDVEVRDRLAFQHARVATPMDSFKMKRQVEADRGRDFELRVGTEADLDLLCDIDLDAGALFVRAGLDLDLPAGHEFFVYERSRWLDSLVSGRTLVAMETDGSAIGFAATGVRDEEAYLDQLSVRTQFMRRGVGTALLVAAECMAQRARQGTLWLTTYAHLGWNRPFYGRAGFVVVPEAECGPEILAEVAYERRWLPCPDQRVIMRKQLL